MASANDSNKVDKDVDKNVNIATASLDNLGTSTDTHRNWTLRKEKYVDQLKSWPASGRHILAQFDDVSVVVYQAFKPSLAEFAVKNQRFGGPQYSFDRMTWIKTSFMWMMFRSGWAQKNHQERVLAIRISRKGFENILSQAHTIVKQKASNLETKDIEVRLQWDPDHDPKGEKLVRRAIQLGLKGKTQLDFATTYIHNITDITDYVHEQYNVLQTQGIESLVSPLEMVYTPSDPRICQQIELDVFEHT
ncbi:hypothetical protein Btru_070094 [Bulinus truncatus]|nr:hypothetical protein Btru_070094 [Bulinus truncatus]